MVGSARNLFVRSLDVIISNRGGFEPSPLEVDGDQVQESDRVLDVQRTHNLLHVLHHIYTAAQCSLYVCHTYRRRPVELRQHRGAGLEAVDPKVLCYYHGSPGLLRVVKSCVRSVGVWVQRGTKLPRVTKGYHSYKGYKVFLKISNGC